jgi:hypothetical protein
LKSSLSEAGLNGVKDVLSLEIKPEEKVDEITNIVLVDPSKISELIVNLKQGIDAEKGTLCDCTGNSKRFLLIHHITGRVCFTRHTTQGYLKPGINVLATFFNM